MRGEGTRISEFFHNGSKSIGGGVGSSVSEFFYLRIQISNKKKIGVERGEGGEVVREGGASESEFF